MTPFEQEFTSVLQSKAIRKQAMNFTHNYDTANDLLQDVALAALRFKDKFKEGSNMGAWVSMILKNQFINSRRLVKSTPIKYVEFPELIPCPSVENAAIRHEESLQLHRIINTLPLRLSDPLRMSMSGMKYVEIASELGVPIGTVKSNVFEAKKRIGKVLGVQKPERKHENVSPVLQCVCDGTVIREWNTAREAVNATGIAHSHIGNCLRGGRPTAGGFIWKFKNAA